ncbi:MAG: hypothetical protein EOO40_02790 [Deltaproteobacteria bacterium]|nr:MAG: hypothetical protein EOO40_02790 [Deltaproteobacteria bacterium]
MLANGANLHSVCLVYPGILALKDIWAPLTVTEVACAWVAAGSQGAAIVLVPAYRYRLIVRRTTSRPIAGDAAICVALCAWTVAHVMSTREATTVGDFGLAKLEPVGVLVDMVVRLVGMLLVLLGPMGAMLMTWLVRDGSKAFARRGGR